MTSTFLPWVRSVVCLGVAVGGGEVFAGDSALQQGFGQAGFSMASVQSAGPAAWGSRVAAPDARLEAEMARSSLTVIELPAEDAPGMRSRRPHRALSFRSETPQRMLRTIGVEASDCYTRLRMPTRVTRDETTGERDVQFAAHVGFACKF